MEFWKNANRSSYVPDLTFDPCFRGESGEKEGKGEAKRGKERQMGRGSVGRMSDFHADETYALVRCITRANTRCKQLGTVDYRW